MGAWMPTEDPVRVVSSHLFGQVNKLEVLALIARHPTGIVHHGDLIATSGRTDCASSYHKALQDLLEAGLLEKLPRDGHKQPYRRVDSALWSWASEFVIELQAKETARHLRSVTDRQKTA